MKLPKTTWILILLALGLGSFVYFYEIKGKTQPTEIKAQKQKIFSFTANDVQSLTIKAKRNLIILLLSLNKMIQFRMSRPDTLTIPAIIIENYSTIL
jgi:hypothetical protein